MYYLFEPNYLPHSDCYRGPASITAIKANSRQEAYERMREVFNEDVGAQEAEDDHYWAYKPDRRPQKELEEVLEYAKDRAINARVRGTTTIPDHPFLILVEGYNIISYGWDEPLEIKDSIGWTEIKPPFVPTPQPDNPKWGLF